VLRELSQKEAREGSHQSRANLRNPSMSQVIISAFGWSLRKGQEKGREVADVTETRNNKKNTKKKPTREEELGLSFSPKGAKNLGPRYESLPNFERKAQVKNQKISQGKLPGGMFRKNTKGSRRGGESGIFSVRGGSSEGRKNRQKKELGRQKSGWRNGDLRIRGGKNLVPLVSFNEEVKKEGWEVQGGTLPLPITTTGIKTQKYEKRSPSKPGTCFLPGNFGVNKKRKRWRKGVEDEELLRG